MSHDTDKLIRQLSLVAFLMAERRPLTARDVKQNVEGYQEMSDEAFARRFYSDRAELIALGVPLDSQRDEFTGEELYRLSSERYFLPPLELTDEELAALQTCLYLLEGQFAYAEPLRLALQNLALGRPGLDAAPTETGRAVELHDPLHRAGSGRGDVAGQRPRPAAEVQDAQRGRRRRVERVEQVSGPADVLELQMRVVGEVDVALRGVVDQQRPGRGAVRVGHQLGPPVVQLDPDDRRGEPASACVVHRGILPRADGDMHRARERVTRVTRAWNTAFLA